MKMEMRRENQEYQIPTLDFDELSINNSKKSERVAKEGNTLEVNLVNFFTAVLNCEKVINDEEREYDYRLISAKYIEDSNRLTQENIQNFIELFSKEYKCSNKPDLREDGTDSVDIFKALKSDMDIYSHLIVGEEKSIAIKSNRKESFYIFDANKELWLEEADKENFNKENFLKFKFKENQKEIYVEGIVKTEQANPNVIKNDFSLFLQTEKLDITENSKEVKTNKADVSQEIKPPLCEDQLRETGDDGRETLEFKEDQHLNTLFKENQYLSLNNKELKIFYKNNEINCNRIRTFFDYVTKEQIAKENNKKKQKSPEKKDNEESKLKDQSNSKNKSGKKGENQKLFKIEENVQTEIAEEIKEINDSEQTGISPKGNSQNNETPILQETENKEELQRIKPNQEEKQLVIYLQAVSDTQNEKVNQEIIENQSKLNIKESEENPNKHVGSTSDEYKNIGFFTFAFPVKTESNCIIISNQISRHFFFVFENNKKTAEIDGLLRFTNNYPKPDILELYSLQKIIETHIWPTFREWIPSLFDKSYEKYLESFKDLNDYYILIESKNNSDLFYLTYQVDRSYCHHKRNILKEKKIIVLMAFDFKDNLINEKLGENKKEGESKIKEEYLDTLYKKLEILKIKGIESLIMLNIPNDEFMSLELFKTTPITGNLFNNLLKKQQENKLNLEEKARLLKENARLLKEKELDLKENARLLKEKELDLIENARVLKEKELENELLRQKTKLLEELFANMSANDGPASDENCLKIKTEIRRVESQLESLKEGEKDKITNVDEKNNIFPSHEEDQQDYLSTKGDSN